MGSRLNCSLVEAELGKYVAREFGGEITIISGSVDTAGLEEPKICRSTSTFEKKAKMLSREEQSSVVSVMESGRSGIIISNRTLSQLAKNKKSSSCNQNANIRFRETYSIAGTM